MVKQSGSEITLESLDHFLVLRQIQGTTKFDQLGCLLRLLGFHVNISPVHVDNTFCHVQVCLVRLVRVARACHEIALGKIFSEQGPVHPTELLLRDACLLVVRQSAEQEFHVKIWPHALHLLNNLRYIRKFEALEGTLGVIDARQHGKKTDTEVVPENDLHHVWLVVVTLRMTQGPLLHQESSLSSIASTHAHGAAVNQHSCREKTAQRHIRRKVAICVHDQMRHLTGRLLHERTVLGYPVQTVQNGTTLSTLLGVGQLSISREEQQLLIDGFL
mmetsp:Transcript_42774/g.112815  ORF Transcript_42774/g.112815 Transcript_42774/m.112815 type:complete len:274 (+) Transcript_42774:67-888(+)